MKQIKHPMFENELVKTPVILLIQTQSKVIIPDNHLAFGNPAK